MTKAIISLLFLLISTSALAGNANCTYDGKDYDGPGYSLPYRKGVKIIGVFGCHYQCECTEGSRSKTRVAHTLRESHFDINFNSKTATGGPSRARWFICPQSVKPGTFLPVYDEIGHPRYYTAEIEDRPFNANRSNVAELVTWAEKNCQ